MANDGRQKTVAGNDVRPESIRFFPPTTTVFRSSRRLPSKCTPFRSDPADVGALSPSERDWFFNGGKNTKPRTVFRIRRRKYRFRFSHIDFRRASTAALVYPPSRQNFNYGLNVLTKYENSDKIKIENKKKRNRFIEQFALLSFRPTDELPGSPRCRISVVF